MQSRSSRTAMLSLASLLVLAGVPAASALDAVTPDVPANVRLGGGSAARSVERAVVGARRRLAEVSCRQTLTDFVDASGRDLEAALDTTGLTPEEYLDQVLFYDGSHAARRCKAEGIYAVTTPGSRVVFICGRRFVELQGTRPKVAQALIIHEMLHSLGLPDDHPTSWDITLKVRSRCAE